MSSRHTYEFIKRSFEKERYILLTKEYSNSKTKLEYICSNGHAYHTHWNMWQQGHKCPFCNGSRLDFDVIKQDFLKEGYTVVSKDYKHFSKINYVCPKGHHHTIKLNNWKNGKRCPYCSGNIRKSFVDVKYLIEKEKYKLLSNEYKNAHTKLYIECPKGHIFKSSWHNWSSNGRRCPICPSQQSKFEKEIRKFINFLGFEYVTNDRTILTNPETRRSLELDIFFPILNKAIECNGLYWHTDDKVSNRDMIKQSLCSDKGIDLFVITDNQWNNDNHAVKNKIKYFLNGELK